MRLRGFPWTRINDEVFVAADEIVQLDAGAIEFLKAQALRNERGRARICAHKHSTDSLHEMLIAMRQDTYIRPHRHAKKVESFHLIDGAADVVIFDEAGEIDDVIELGPDQNFFYRLETPRYHTVIINSPVFVVHEVTNGPFDPKEADFASFSPVEGKNESRAYVSKLRARVSTWKHSHDLRP
jgi:cupin fold WbuC family metalloprotein